MIILDLWVAGESSGQISAKLGLTRNAVMGVVHRAGKRLKAETGENPYARPDHSRSTKNGLRHPISRAPKPKKIAKPPQVKRVIDFAKVTPGDLLPPLVKLDERLWISLPNTTPKDLLSLSGCECRWPLSTGVENVGDSGSSLLFCAAKQADDSSYCPTHTRWSRSQKKTEPLNFGKAA